MALVLSVLMSIPFCLHHTAKSECAFCNLLSISSFDLLVAGVVYRVDTLKVFPYFIFSQDGNFADLYTTIHGEMYGRQRRSKVIFSNEAGE